MASDEYKRGYKCGFEAGRIDAVTELYHDKLIKLDDACACLGMMDTEFFEAIGTIAQPESTVETVLIVAPKGGKPSSLSLVEKLDIIIDSKTMNFDQLSEKYNVSKSTLSRVLKKHGAEKSSGRPSKLSEDQKLQLIEDSQIMSLQELSEKYGLSKPSISIILKNSGNPKRKEK